MRNRIVLATVIAVTLAMAMLSYPGVQNQRRTFDLMDTSIEAIQNAYKSGDLTAHELTQMYLDRIDAYDQKGPKLNAIITLNPNALKEADRLDMAFKSSGLVGPLHGIPIVLKDQVDVAGLPTTLGSVAMKDYMPTRDAFVTEQLKKAGAIILAKTTLGELAQGDTYGSLFGVTRNPYDLLRTVGGSSGGTSASVTANFATIGIGQEQSSSTRRPATWNSLVGMRPTAGLVSRSGVWSGWPSITGTLTPITRTVADLARLLDVMVSYDPEDPVTALAVGQIPKTYTASLDGNGLKGARIGILRESIGQDSDPNAPDFKKVTDAFNKSVAELQAAGAQVIDPIVIPKLNELMNTNRRSTGLDPETVFFSRNPNSPYKTRQDFVNSPDYSKIFNRTRGFAPGTPGALANPSRGGLPVAARSNGNPFEDRPAGNNPPEYSAREELMINIMKVMADNKLDAIVHKSVEHTANLISDGINPPFYNHRGSPRLNTFLIFASSITVPAGFTDDGLPVGITFFGRPYSEPTMIKLAYAYEQATHHRKPPPTTPSLTAKR
jgi:amidase